MGCRCKRSFQNCWFWSQTGASPLFLCPRNEMEVPRRRVAGLKVASGLPVTMWLPSVWCQHKTALHSTLNKVYSTVTGNLFMSTSVAKVYAENRNADADVSQTCQLHMCSADQQYFHTTLNSIKGTKAHAHTQSPFLLQTNYGRIMLSP